MAAKAASVENTPTQESTPSELEGFTQKSQRVYDFGIWSLLDSISGFFLKCRSISRSYAACSIPPLMPYWQVQKGGVHFAFGWPYAAG